MAGDAGGAVLEELMVEISTNSKGLEEDLSSAETGLEDFGKQAKKTGDDTEKHVEQNVSSMKGLVQGAVSALGALGAGSFLKEAFLEFENAASHERKLRIAIEANGKAVDDLLPKYKDWASEIEKTYGADGDLTLSMLKQAESMGISGDAAMRATKNALALGAAQGTSAEAFIKQTVALEMGNSAMLARYLPSLKDMQEGTGKTAEAQRLLGNMFAQVEGEAESVSGQIAILDHYFGDLLESFGEIVSKGIGPVVQMFKWLHKQFTDLSEESRTMVVVLAAVTAGVLALTAAISVAGVVFNTMFGGIGIVVGLIASLGVGAAVWINTMGGVEKSWEKVQTKAEEFWTWSKPVRQALGSFFDAMLEKGQEAWDAIKTAASDAWEWIAGKSEANWEKIATDIQTAILFGEYVLRNFRTVADYVWVSIKLGWVETANEIEHFFTGVIPALLDWFSNNWVDVFKDAFNLTAVMHKNLIQNMVNILAALPSIIKGKVKLGDLWTPLTDGFKSAIKSLPSIPDREMSALEKKLKGQVDAQRNALATGFDEFKELKLVEFAFPEWEEEKTKDKAGMVGGDVGKEFKQGMGEQVEAVLFGSAEALQRISDYQDKLAESRSKIAPQLATSNAPSATSAGMMLRGGGGMASEKSEAYLKDIANTLKRQEKKPGLQLEVGAGL